MPRRVWRGAGVGVAIVLLLISRSLGAGPGGTRQVAPGLRYRWWVDPAGPWAIHVLEVDLRHEVSLVTAKALDLINGRETVRSIAERARRSGLRVLAAVNGDFFTESGEPVGIQICRGIPLRNPTHRSALVITEARKAFITPLAVRMVLVNRRGDSLQISRLNHRPLTDELSLFNRFAGGELIFHRPVAALRCILVDSLRVGTAARLVSVDLDSSAETVVFGGKQLLFAARGKAKRQLVSLFPPGDTFRAVIQLRPDLGSPVVEAIGGLPRLVRDGRVSIEVEREGGSGFRDIRHPRTAVGVSQDGYRVFLVVVDGRQEGYSVGMTLGELAELTIRLGCYDALNLDGGGSSTMLVDGKVVNRPSDPVGERPVANALLVVARP
ncbi:MAG: phosphodiester glycosidase family protein [candidate division KSB1 bacterium]|nr:phosphodiester glycosidase family protein [candidate division KSB1 bacterium]